MVPAQIKAFFDSCGQLWQNGDLKNKFVGTFFSTSYIGAGQETTALTALPFFAHMGMIYVSIGGKHKNLLDSKVVHGGSAYGAGTIAGAGDNTPIKLELDVRMKYGFHFYLSNLYKIFVNFFFL
jgi:NAD(P)H dehydrogenase (quinone)